MEHNSDFRYDLQVGIIGEEYVGDILSFKKIEVKTDYKAKQTGNLFVEYESRNKPSGIATTEADFYCFVISNEQIIFIETNKLKEMCREYYHTSRNTVGGDSNTSKGILLPLEKILK